MDQLIAAGRYALAPAAGLERERWTELASYHGEQRATATTGVSGGTQGERQAVRPLRI
ncbi:MULTISPECIES: hypothetical protein [unclassified Rhodococcus (in: high G+C Gram-positive bacteria)]|uniref:hypothetical protein n=1 Tax=unclassified Rhodococcus (in: high G+C Gram-positive bacteria) TaxID=192944 RepID=UPI0015C619CA|nr:MULTISPECIES: hypothetical protein [unclassified Rhodococcus (in: high G+C Gram-positive bacteria)]